jgi:hypothetical protein
MQALSVVAKGSVDAAGLHLAKLAPLEEPRAEGAPRADAKAMTEGKTGLPDTVMFTIATNGYVPYVRNLHASLARLGLAENLLIYSLDDQAHSELIDSGLASIRHEAYVVPEWSDWHTPGFVRIMSFKYAVALPILEAGRNALYVDSDIVFLRDPFAHLRSVIETSSADIVLQYEAGTEAYCAGFWFARPTPHLIDLFRRLSAELEAGAHDCDQPALNTYVEGGLGVTAERLDPELYACGNQFLDTVHPKSCEYVDRSKRPFDFDAAYLLHFNYVVGKEPKAWQMLKHSAVFDAELAALGQRGRWEEPRLLVRRLRWAAEARLGPLLRRVAR